MIATQYVREAVRIRKRFEQVRQLLTEYESELKTMRNELEGLKSKLVSIRPLMHGIIRDKKVYEAVTSFERMEAKIKDKIKPLEDEMNHLRIQSNALYDSLKERYPNLSDEQLKDALFAQMI